MAFRFRQFTVEDRNSTLRVGTDSMLLGSWATAGNAVKILDIGTGCGVIALMIAQKSSGMITAIDIDQPSVWEAGANFASSPWPSRLEAIHESVQSLAAREQSAYDFIITNPPYHSNSLKSPSSRINKARHDGHLPIGDLAIHVSRLLISGGRFCIILPPAPSDYFHQVCAINGLFPLRMTAVFPKPSRPAKRIMTEFTKRPAGLPLQTELSIVDEKGKFTAEYLALTMSYHNF